MNEKRLCKARQGRMLAGVCSGVAKYFGIDPTLVRLAWVVFCLLGGCGVLLYLIAAILMPNEPEEFI